MQHVKYLFHGDKYLPESDWKRLNGVLETLET